MNPMTGLAREFPTEGSHGVVSRKCASRRLPQMGGATSHAPGEATYSKDSERPPWIFGPRKAPASAKFLIGRSKVAAAQPSTLADYGESGAGKELPGNWYCPGVWVRGGMPSVFLED